MDVPLHDLSLTYIVTYVMYGQLTFVLWYVGKLGRRSKINKQKYFKKHRLFGWIYVIDLFVSMYVVRQFGKTDNVVYIESWLLSIHLIVFIALALSSIGMLIINGNKYPSLHKRLFWIMIASYGLTIGTGIFFTHFLSQTTIISSLP